VICARKNDFVFDYFKWVNSTISRNLAIDAERQLAKISAVNEAASSRSLMMVPVAAEAALLSLIGLVLIGAIGARCGPPT
jgi:hypothetical protein